MRRLYFLEPDTAAAAEAIAVLRAQSVPTDQISVLANRDVARELKVRQGTLDEASDVDNARKRGLLAGALLGGLTGFLIAWFADADTMLLLIGTALGATLGLTFGFFVSSLVGPSEEHPILQGYRERIEQGEILVISDIPAVRADEVSSALQDARPGVDIEVSTLTSALARGK